jgi:hypothetical protein
MTEPIFIPQITRHRAAILAMVTDSPVTKDLQRFYRVKARLGKLEATLSRKNAVIVQYVQYFLNQEVKRHIPEHKTKRDSAHMLTDHATLRSMERMYGIDIIKLKDYILNDLIQDRNFELVRSIETNQVITILRKI